MNEAELESKLDEDFLFYLGFANVFLRRVSDADVKKQCEAWLKKLIGEAVYGVELKRCRNIYFSQLLIYMQSGGLDGPFLAPPVEVDISNAMEIFHPIPVEVETPAWLLDELDNIPEKDLNPKNGRTYIATRTLPGGQGAFAYIAVSVGEEEPMWLGGGEGGLAAHLSQKYKDKIPPVYEMEKILAKRKDPKERQKVLTFYDILMQNISDELDGIVPQEENETVNGLVEQLVEDLESRGEYENFRCMCPEGRRRELLIMLHDRVQCRRNKVAKREEVLDDLEEKLMPKSFFETSVAPEDKYELPAEMWQHVINKPPNKKCMDKLQCAYPKGLVDKFLELLNNEKEEIAMGMQRRHENMIAQMRKELRKEGEKGQLELEEWQAACNAAVIVLKDVREQYQKKTEIEMANENATEIEKTEHSKLYDQMRSAIFEKQKSVESEAQRGRALAAQINAISEQTEMLSQVNMETVRKTEQSNMAIMRNIKKLTAAVKMYEKRVREISDLTFNAQDQCESADGKTSTFFA